MWKARRSKMAYELVRQHITAAGAFYVGKAETATMDVTYPPYWLPGVTWVADQINNNFANKMVGEGKLLQTQVYADPGQWYELYDMRVVVSAVPAPEGSITAIGWTALAMAALIVGGIAFIYFLLREVKTSPYLGPAFIGLGIGAGALGVAYLVKTVRNI
jgi:hypothetical protein